MPKKDRNDPGKLPSQDEERGISLPDPYPDYITCPQCGELEVEVWCYETKAQCHNCGKWIDHTLEQPDHRSERKRDRHRKGLYLMRKRIPLAPEVVEPHACSIDLRLRILKGVPFFAGLDGDAVTQVNHFFRERAFYAGESICYAGDAATHLYVIASGKVKLIRHTLAGQDVVLDILKPGEFFGSLSALGDETYTDTAEAQTNCCILTIASKSFQTILNRHPAVPLKVLEIVAQRLRNTQEVVKEISVYSVERRIASTLLKLGERLGESKGRTLLIQSPLSHQDLAAMTGTTVETVSRILSQFRKEGLIQSGRQWIAIADQKQLQRIAQE